MTLVLTLLALAATFVALAAYARHDRFAGPGNVTQVLDDLGAVGDPHLVRL
ncbi:MAG TPA: hypothetical protein VGE38_00560 [Nocardioides sp.]|uniref:hypothetical protein n=1 Tax=Nocardioides sp. TaxID=35761 RepID=UPI002ED8DF19